MKKVLLFTTIFLALIVASTIVSANLSDLGNKRLSIRERNTDGSVYLGEDRTYDSLFLSLSVSRIRKDVGRGTIRIRLNRDERMTIKLLPRERIYISAWTEDYIVVNQNARVKYYNRNNPVRWRTEYVGVQYVVWPNEGHMKFVFPWENSYFILRLDELGEMKCNRHRCSIR